MTLRLVYEKLKEIIGKAFLLDEDIDVGLIYCLSDDHVFLGVQANFMDCNPFHQAVAPIASVGLQYV